MPTLKADRRLYVTADRSQIVEESDVRGAWLLASEGRTIGPSDVEKYGLSMKGGRVHYDGAPDLPAIEVEDESEAKQAETPEDKQAESPENKAAGGDVDESSDEGAEGAEEGAAPQLPDDIPHRDELIDAGVASLEALRDLEDLTALPGIGKAKAADIKEYLADGAD